MTSEERKKKKMLERQKAAAEKKTIVYQVTSIYKNTIAITNYLMMIEMNTQNADCYANRYTDLAGMNPSEHYLTVGKDQGRLWSCGKNLTRLEGQQYLWRYPDLQHLFEGSLGDKYYQLASEHFMAEGFSQKRQGDRDKGFEPWLCNDGERQDLYQYKATCTCIGDIVTGLAYRPDNGQFIKTFDELRQWYTESHFINGTEDVSHPAFAPSTTIFQQEQKQVWCERRNRANMMSLCAKEDGDDCMCAAGNYIVYGSQDLNSVFNGYFFIDVVNATDGGHLDCDVEGMGGVDPLKGQKKSCYCIQDASAVKGIYLMMQANKKYWLNVLYQLYLEQQRTIIITREEQEIKIKRERMVR